MLLLIFIRKMIRVRSPVIDMVWVGSFNEFLTISKSPVSLHLIWTIKVILSGLNFPCWNWMRLYLGQFAIQTPKTGVYVYSGSVDCSLLLYIWFILKVILTLFFNFLFPWSVDIYLPFSKLLQFPEFLIALMQILIFCLLRANILRNRIDFKLFIQVFFQSILFLLSNINFHFEHRFIIKS